MIERFKDWRAERRIRRLARRYAIAITRAEQLHAELSAVCLARSSAQIARMHRAILAKAGR